MGNLEYFYKMMKDLADRSPDPSTGPPMVINYFNLTKVIISRKTKGKLVF